VLATVLGFLLQDNPTLQEQVLDSAVAQVPVIASEIERNVNVGEILNTSSRSTSRNPDTAGAVEGTI
jgi:hypothetical protein